MKAILAITLSLFVTSAYAQDDRYFASWGNNYKNYTTHKQVKVKIAKTKYAREHRNKRVRVAAVPRYEGETYTSDPVQWAARSIARGVGEIIGGRPNGCPARAWCGCWLSKHLGIGRRDLWLARNWASVGAPSSRAIGSVVVWRHHVGLITDVSGARIKVLSGNDGRAVRNRWRHVGGVIAYRRI